MADVGCAGNANSFARRVRVACARGPLSSGALDGVLQLFVERILPFDIEAARRYADLAVKARAAGRGFPTPDGYVAAIAAAHGFAVASRDTSAFAAAGLTVIDPWTVTG